MITNLFKTPWPWFGGKADAAPFVWTALGDCAHYVEPFAGSLAVLLRRPHPCNRTYYSETVNDLDGLLVNAWRSLQMSPDAMAEAASWPVSEADLHARHLALVRWRSERQLEHLMGDPLFHDPVMAGWWAWGQSCWIGSGFCSGEGGWTANADGRLERTAKLPHLGNNGQGVNRPQCREPGVSKKRPHLGNNGQGVNHAGCREPGVSKQLPHLGNDGRGVNHAGCREPGVSKKLPHLGNDGQGVNHAGCREPGVSKQLPHLGNNGRGEPETEMDFHPLTMPELQRWVRFLSARLRHVRILNGDWKRSLTGGASLSLSVRQGLGPCGVFLDPPYSTEAERAGGLYAVDDLSVAHEVRAWAKEHGEDPRYRIVLAGYAGEHEDLAGAGWTRVEWYRQGFLRGGMGNTGGGEKSHQQDRERLWLSPHCARTVAAPRQQALFG